MDKLSKKAVVLLSGGIDSYTTAAMAKESGYEIYAISFDYNQRHRYELKSAGKIAENLGVKKHLSQNLDLRKIGGSALTDDIEVPKQVSIEDIGDEIPITYVPARNTIFLSVALGWAESLGVYDIFIGANALDYSGYPDCRPEYLKSFEAMANLATKAGVEGNRITIHAPLLELSKADIIKKGLELGLDYSLSFSCYDPGDNGDACGECESCQLRHRGFIRAGVADPTIYKNKSELS